MRKTTKIPDAAIERLALYSRPLRALIEGGVAVISSEKLAEFCGVNPAQVRKDLAYFGEFGVRGVGYDVGDLLREIKKILQVYYLLVWFKAVLHAGNRTSGFAFAQVSHKITKLAVLFHEIVDLFFEFRPSFLQIFHIQIKISPFT